MAADVILGAVTLFGGFLRETLTPALADVWCRNFSGVPPCPSEVLLALCLHVRLLLRVSYTARNTQMMETAGIHCLAQHGPVLSYISHNIWAPLLSSPSPILRPRYEFLWAGNFPAPNSHLWRWDVRLWLHARGVYCPQLLTASERPSAARAQDCAAACNKSELVSHPIASLLFRWHHGPVLQAILRLLEDADTQLPRL